ncbi:MAG: hypothetical protein ACK4ND_18535 [Cytophagaceae bacterium]
MKRLNSTLFLSIIFSVIVVFTGCKKEEEAETTLGSATIIGKVKINGYDLERLPENFNELDADAQEARVKEAKAAALANMAGAKVFATQDTRELVLNPSGNNYVTKYYETTIDASGNFTFTVDANVQAVDVDLDPEDFRKGKYEYVTNDSPTVTVHKGRKVYVDLEYNEVVNE